MLIHTKSSLEEDCHKYGLRLAELCGDLAYLKACSSHMVVTWTSLKCFKICSLRLSDMVETCACDCYDLTLVSKIVKAT